MEYGAGAQRAEHGAYLFKVFLFYLFIFEFFLAEGLDFVQAGKVILELGIQFTHAFLGSLEERAHFLGKNYAGKENQRNRAAGNQRQLPVYHKKNDEDARKGHQVGDHFGYHMCIKQFKIPGVIYYPAHQISGLLIMEEAQIQMLQLVIHPAAQIPYQVPGSFMRQIIA